MNYKLPLVMNNDITDICRNFDEVYVPLYREDPHRRDLPWETFASQFITNGRMKWSNDLYNYEITFDTEEDMTVFILRWS